MVCQSSLPPCSKASSNKDHLFGADASNWYYALMSNWKSQGNLCLCLGDREEVVTVTQGDYSVLSVKKERERERNRGEGTVRI